MLQVPFTSHWCLILHIIFLLIAIFPSSLRLYPEQWHVHQHITDLWCPDRHCLLLCYPPEKLLGVHMDPVPFLSKEFHEHRVTNTKQLVVTGTNGTNFFGSHGKCPSTHCRKVAGCCRGGISVGWLKKTDKAKSVLLSEVTGLNL